MMILITYALPNNTVRRIEIFSAYKDRFFAHLIENDCRAIMYTETK